MLQQSLVLQGQLAFVLLEPLIEALQFRIQCSGGVNVARADKVVFEVGVELEHIAEVFRAGETEASIGLRVSRRCTHTLMPRALGQLFGHLRAGQVLACDRRRSFPTISFPFLKMP